MFLQLLEDLGLTQSNIVKTPRLKLSASEAETIENSPIREGEQATTFRSENHAMCVLGAGPCGHL